MSPFWALCIVGVCWVVSSVVYGFWFSEAARERHELDAKERAAARHRARVRVDQGEE